MKKTATKEVFLVLPKAMTVFFICVIVIPYVIRQLNETQEDNDTFDSGTLDWYHTILYVMIQSGGP